MRSDSTRNLLDLALENWSFMKEHRRLLYCPRTLRALISGEHPKLEHASMNNEKHMGQLRDKAADFALYVQFMQSFEAYRVLSVDDKLIITKAFLSVFLTLEQFYITYENRGHETGRIHSHNYTYFALGSSEPSSDERQPAPCSTPCTSAETDRDKKGGFKMSKSGTEKCLSADQSFRDLVHDTFQSSLATIVAAMERTQMTDVEFLGISLMILFDPQRDGLSEIARKVLSDTRNQLSTDWLDLYTKCGICNGEERMGNSVLLLPAIYQNSHDHGQIYHMMRLFGSLEYDKLIDEITL